MQGSKILTFHKNDVIVAEGSHFQRIWQIDSGTCRIEKNTSPKPLGKMEAEETFGEISFLLSGGASASVIADSDVVTCHVIEGYFINILFHMKPMLAGRFYKYLAKTIQRTFRKRENAQQEQEARQLLLQQSEEKREEEQQPQPRTKSKLQQST